MPQRTYEAEAEPFIPEGFWPGQAVEGATRSDLEALMLDAAVVLDRVGGVFTIMALREELTDTEGNPTGLFASVGFRGKWESFAPARRAPARQQEAPGPVAVPDPEPAAELLEDEPAGEDPVDDFGPDAEQALAEAR